MDLKEALYGADHAHVCTQESCPDDARYYVSCVDDNLSIYPMAGPYPTHAEALADVQKAMRAATAVDPKAWWMSWGTFRKLEGKLTPGILNKHGLL